MAIAEKSEVADFTVRSPVHLIMPATLSIRSVTGNSAYDGKRIGHVPIMERLKQIKS
jgi:hypothetical protein